MAADKTIWECPVITLVSQLDGSNRVVMQPSSGAEFDYGVPLSLLSSFILGNFQIGLSSGTVNPDPSAGNNGDLYFQTTTGHLLIKEKIGGSWVLKADVILASGSKSLTLTEADSRMSYASGRWIFTYDSSAFTALGNDEPFDNMIISGQSQNIRAGYTYSGSNIATIIWDGGFSGSETFKIKLINY